MYDIDISKSPDPAASLGKESIIYLALFYLIQKL